MKERQGGIRRASNSSSQRKSKEPEQRRVDKGSCAEAYRARPTGGYESPGGAEGHHGGAVGGVQGKKGEASTGTDDDSSDEAGEDGGCSPQPQPQPQSQPLPYGHLAKGSPGPCYYDARHPKFWFGREGERQRMRVSQGPASEEIVMIEVSQERDREIGEEMRFAGLAVVRDRCHQGVYEARVKDWELSQGMGTTNEEEQLAVVKDIGREVNRVIQECVAGEGVDELVQNSHGAKVLHTRRDAKYWVMRLMMMRKPECDDWYEGDVMAMTRAEDELAGREMRRLSRDERECCMFGMVEARMLDREEELIELADQGGHEFQILMQAMKIVACMDLGMDEHEIEKEMGPAMGGARHKMGAKQQESDMGPASMSYKTEEVERGEVNAWDDEEGRRERASARKERREWVREHEDKKENQGEQREERRRWQQGMRDRVVEQEQQHEKIWCDEQEGIRLRKREKRRKERERRKEMGAMSKMAAWATVHLTGYGSSRRVTAMQGEHEMMSEVGRLKMGQRCDEASKGGHCRPVAPLMRLRNHGRVKMATGPGVGCGENGHKVNRGKASVVTRGVELMPRDRWGQFWAHGHEVRPPEAQGQWGELWPFGHEVRPPE